MKKRTAGPGTADCCFEPSNLHGAGASLIFILSIFFIQFVFVLMLEGSPASEGSDDESDDNFVGVGGKWEFVGEPSKRNARRKYYNVTAPYRIDCFGVPFPHCRNPTSTNPTLFVIRRSRYSTVLLSVSGRTCT